MATQPINQFTDTWDDALTDYVGIGLGITNTNSGAGSRLIEIKVDGVDKFAVDKNGVIVVGSFDGVVFPQIALDGQDKILIQDASDSDTVKTLKVSDILNAMNPVPPGEGSSFPYFASQPIDAGASPTDVDTNKLARGQAGIYVHDSGGQIYLRFVYNYNGSVVWNEIAVSLA